MFEVQRKVGLFGNTTCWPPFESSNYQGTTIAATAAATVPGWLAKLSDKILVARIDKIKKYLRITKPPHDYGRLLLLWAATRLPDLLDKEQKGELIAKVWKHQRNGGGWSIRTFAAPEAWGRGNRAEKLRAEPEFKDPPSDKHQTGLAIMVLRDAGVPSSDGQIARSVKWLLKNQRESGRWWTWSLNTEGYHFITFSGTCYPLLALAKCDALPKDQVLAAKLDIPRVRLWHERIAFGYRSPNSKNIDVIVFSGGSLLFPKAIDTLMPSITLPRVIFLDALASSFCYVGNVVKDS